MTTITINGKTHTIDTSKGYDVIRGKKAVAHVETYEEARRECAKRRGAYIQYYLEKG